MSEQMAPTPIDTLQAERDHYRESNRKASDRILELTKELAQYRGIIDRVVNAFLGTLKCPALDLPTGLPDSSPESEARMRGILKTLVQEHCGLTQELSTTKQLLEDEKVRCSEWQQHGLKEGNWRVEAEERLATERAAREAAEQQNKFNQARIAILARKAAASDSEIQEEIHNLNLQEEQWRGAQQTYEKSIISRAEVAEARLAEAVELLRYVFYYRLPLGDKLEEQLSRSDMERWTAIINLLQSTTPPPLLAEVERLREQLKKLEHQAHFKTYDEAVTRAESLAAQLQIAREALECAGYALTHPNSDQGFATRSVEAALAQITEAHQNSPAVMPAGKLFALLASKITDMETMETMTVAEWIVLAKKSRQQCAQLNINIAEIRSQHAREAADWKTDDDLARELNELRAFKAGALKLTTEASVQTVLQTRPRSAG